MAIEGVEARFMYSMFDYTTWNIYSGDEWIGQVMLNAADRSVSFLSDDIESALAGFLSQRSYAWWRNWIATSRTDRDVTDL